MRKLATLFTLLIVLVLIALPASAEKRYISTPDLDMRGEYGEINVTYEYTPYKTVELGFRFFGLYWPEDGQFEIAPYNTEEIERTFEFFKPDQGQNAEWFQPITNDDVWYDEEFEVGSVSRPDVYYIDVKIEGPHPTSTFGDFVVAIPTFDFVSGFCVSRRYIPNLEFFIHSLENLEGTIDELIIYDEGGEVFYGGNINLSYVYEGFGRMLLPINWWDYRRLLAGKRLHTSVTIADETVTWPVSYPHVSRELLSCDRQKG